LNSIRFSSEMESTVETDLNVVARRFPKNMGKLVDAHNPERIAAAQIRQ